MLAFLRRYGRYGIDPLTALFAVATAGILRLIRGFGLEHLRLTRGAFEMMGSIPIRRHYYEPLFHPSDLRHALDKPRTLPGLNLREAEQVELLKRFDYEEELTAFPMDGAEKSAFYYNNGAFESGDAELWYSVIRHLKPRTILEVGSGMSTHLARAAIRKNEEELSGYRCRHVCIEPYEAGWLEKAALETIRTRVEEVDFVLFESLQSGDLLFIDSSHVVRPQGDVLFLFQEVLPRLREGVTIHVHDIFTPRDYPEEWVLQSKRMWNEQYLVEALLAGSSWLTVLLAANYLAHERRTELADKAPVFRQQASWREPGSLYLRRTGPPLNDPGQ
jgi:hypothetical protein